jgi:hypothetical protein
MVGRGTRKARAISSVDRPAQRAQGQRHLGLDGQGRVAAGEDQAQRSSAPARLLRRHQLGQLLALALGHRGVAEIVDGLVASGADQPGPRVLGRPLLGPLPQGRLQRGGQRVLGPVEVAHHADERGQDPAPLLLEDRAMATLWGSMVRSEMSITRTLAPGLLVMALLGCGSTADAPASTLPPRRHSRQLRRRLSEHGPDRGACAVEGRVCTYGDAPRIECRVQATCKSGQWSVTSTTCAAPAPASQCPATTPAMPTGCDTPTASCRFPDGAECQCFANAALGPPKWTCNLPLTPAAPAPHAPQRADHLRRLHPQLHLCLRPHSRPVGQRPLRRGGDLGAGPRPLRRHGRLEERLLVVRR